MDEFLKPINLVLLALAIVGLAFAVYAYAKTLRRKTPRWAMVTNTLISGYSAKFTELQVLYKGDAVENLSVTKALFWNAGAETIEGGDIASGDPLRIETIDDIRILDAVLLRACLTTFVT
jgi:hypothetical protein